MAEYASPNRVRAPWTPAQVVQLQRWQDSEAAPSFTCEAGHGDLIPTEAGWHCNHADCTAELPTWAWLFMLDPAALESQEAVGSDADDDTKWADYTARKRAAATEQTRERLRSYRGEVQRLLTERPEQRPGQAYFNVLRDPDYGAFDPAAAELVSGTALDTFDHDERISDLITFLQRRWSTPTGPGPICPCCGRTLS